MSPFSRMAFWLVAGMAALALTVALFRSPQVTITMPDSNTSNRISVVGTATAHVEPDIAIVDFGLSKTAPSVEEARAGVVESARNLIEALNALGVTKADIATVSVNLLPQYPPRCAYLQGGGGICRRDVDPNKPISYQFNQSFRVTVNITKVGRVIDAAFGAGVTTISGVQFDLADRAAVETKVQADAVRDARTKAEAIAAASGAKLGGVMSIINNSPYSYYGPYLRYNGDVPNENKPAPIPTIPIEPGVYTINASVTVVFAIN